jgi:hypothetical protein
MAGGGGFREVFDRIEVQRWSAIGLIAAVLRGWVGFLEGAILASLEREDADREALIDAAVAVLDAGIAVLRSDREAD